MEVKLIITEVTRMAGNRVCVAGMSREGTTYRPLFQSAPIYEDWLYDQNHQCIIRPFAKVTFDFLNYQPSRPHSEDWWINPAVKQYHGMYNNPRDFLGKSLSPSVGLIFDAEIHHDEGFYVREGEGTRSLGTVKVKVDRFSHVLYNKWDYRLAFNDAWDRSYSLKITDLSFRYYIDYLRTTKNIAVERISTRMTEILQEREVFLRIGLARPTWERHPHRCYLQVNGIYTFPDYLNGRCFADFRPQA